MDSGSLIVKECTFLNCSSPAIYLKDDYTMLTDCKFVGSGIKCVGWSQPWIFDSSFQNAERALDLVNCTAYLKNVLISDNGLAIVADISSGATISNCTITANDCAIKHWSSPKVHYNICNSIIWGNTIGFSLNDNIIIYSSYSDIQDGWSGIENIDADPLFVNSDSQDYRLVEGSPCIDAGNETPPYCGKVPDHDIEGNPRPQGSGYDMGAYEGAICLNDPIKIGDLYYDDLAEALAGCSGGETVQFHNGTYPGDLDVGMPIVFAGGYDCLFQENDGQGSGTVIDGSLTIVDGPVVIENVVFR